MGPIRLMTSFVHVARSGSFTAAEWFAVPSWASLQSVRATSEN